MSFFTRLAMRAMVLVLFFAALESHAQTLTGFTGTIRTSAGAPIPGATVTITDLKKSAVTDINGHFDIKDVPAGSYKVRVKFIGYKEVTQKVDLNSDKSRELSVKMEDSNEELSEVTVLGRSASQEVNRQAFNVTAVDAKRLHNSTLDLSHALDRVSGVRVRESGGVGSNMNFSLNGFTGRQVKFFIDGIPMDNFGSSFQLNNIPINLAERVEVYKGVVPVSLGSDALGGAVNIITTNALRTYVDASYSYGSFNTHRSTLNAGYTAKNGFTLQINAFQNYSDNNYWVNVNVADINTGEYFRNQRVRRFHDNYHNETLIANVGVVNKKYADKLLFGITLGQNKADIQTGARMVSVFGKWYRKGNIIMPSVKYLKKDLFTKGLDVSITGNFNLGQEQNIDTVYRRYNWFQQYKQYPGLGSERERSLYKFRNNNGLATANFNYRISENHNITLNNVYNAFNRKGSDELLSANDQKYDQPRIANKNITGLGYRYSQGEKWNVSVFAKQFSQWNKFSQSYNPSGNWGDIAYLEQRNTFSKQGYGVAATYFLMKNLQAKGSYEKSYRLPETDELFGDLLNLEGNISLRPESSQNYNFGLSFHGAAGDHRFSIDGNFLYRDAKDFIRPSLNPNQTKQVMTNTASVTNVGVDGEIRYSYRKRFTAGVNMTYQNLRNNTKYEEGQKDVSPLYRDRIPNMPFLFGNGDASLFFDNVIKKGNTLTLGYNILYVHAYYLSWPSQGNDKLDIPRQWNQDVNLVYAMANGKYNVAVECKNIVDNKLYDNFTLQKPGRAFYVKLRYFFSK